MPKKTKPKDPAAVSLGRKGGLKKWAKMTKKQRSQYNSAIALRGWETRRAKLDQKPKPEDK